MARLRRKLGQRSGRPALSEPVQDIRIGGRSGNAEYQYTILGDKTAEVYKWAPKLLAAVESDPALTDVNSDQQQRGLETEVTVDRDTASRLGLTMYQIDNTLYDAFGQRSVSTIYNAAQPVSCGDGGRAAVRAASRDAEANLGQHVRRASERLGNHRTQRGRRRARPLDDFDRLRRVDRACLCRFRARRRRRPTRRSRSRAMSRRIPSNVVPLALPPPRAATSSSGAASSAASNAVAHRRRRLR